MKQETRREFLKAGLLGAGALSLLTGCEVIEAGANIGLQAAGLNVDQADSVIRGTKAAVKSFEGFTPEQEYYIGRSVGTTVINKYAVHRNDKLEEYINLIGLALVRTSSVPETFGGYYFAVLNSSDVNAFAAPSGLIFVTKGIINCCANEDALAAVLAHEIAHVQLNHGLKSIKSARFADLGALLAVEAAGNMTDSDTRQLFNLFEGTVKDISSTMIQNGYSRSYEREADALAMTILDNAGYSGKGMEDMLTLMKGNLKAGGTDFFKTHPSPANRLQDLQAELKNVPNVPAIRKQRFKVQLV